MKPNLIELSPIIPQRNFAHMKFKLTSDTAETQEFKSYTLYNVCFNVKVLFYKSFAGTSIDTRVRFSKSKPMYVYILYLR